MKAGRPAEIEAEIGRTRIRLGRTLGAIEDKLAARHLVQEGLTMVTDSFSGQEGARPRLAEAMRAHPLPLMLIGAGVAWFIASNAGLLERVAEDERVQSAVRQISDIAGTIGDRAAAGAEATGGWVHRAAGAVRGTGGAVIGRAGGYAGVAGERASRIWERNVLLLAAVGVVAGAVGAALLPLSRLEVE